MESVDEILLEADDKMAKSIAFLQQELAGLRTGKASPSLVENINVDYYGVQTRLRQIAGISTPEPRLIVINTYDPTALPAIEKAILASNLGITPMNDGRVIRVPIPELSEERRKDLTKVAHRMAEEARVAIRSVRREANDQAKAIEKGHKITEDERDNALEEIQKYTDAFIKKVDDLLAAKEKDIMAV
ncbi:MAG TPA: ribosome recycling factor [Verrucomicrobia bacterium]|nr:MAG: ribosome recycling factor [Lentisphaerae bacterium GWF2_57_35]HBA83273.1 ribosome recycling factor [Verrucomicrobiota bacterium]